jgi:hypothetical protein
MVQCEAVLAKQTVRFARQERKTMDNFNRAAVSYIPNYCKIEMSRLFITDDTP